MNDTFIPLPVVGPGSQPQDSDAGLDILQLPDEMATFAMPELPDADGLAGMEPALNRLAELLVRLEGTVARPDAAPAPLVLDDLDANNLALVDQLLGEGEVSLVCSGVRPARVQESVLAGVWRVRWLNAQGGVERDVLEVGPVPSLVSRVAFEGARDQVNVDPAAIPEGVLNAPPLFAEINHKAAAWRPGDTSHVINLTLLPQTEADLAYLNAQLGEGAVTILSRGYGNCRISSTATRRVWWVQYFNSQDANILNTLEIGDVPSVAQAAPEDLADSAARLREILEIYR